MKKPVTAIIVGGGHRSFCYADLSLKKPELLKIVGIADPNPERREKAAARYGFSLDYCFENANKLANHPKFADAIINGTMDHQHVDTAIPLLEKGYDMLLEKPFAVNIQEMEKLLAVVEKYNNKVMICHVLRYTPFYGAIKQKILEGAIGDIINIQTLENVSYHHMSTSYVRGKWGNSEKSKTSMLLAKCCHDIDIMMWLMSDTLPLYVSSFGSIFQYKPEKAPSNAGTICLVDCPLVDECIYSAKKIYIEHPDRWSFYVWDALESTTNPSLEDKVDLLKSGSPYGRCIYKSDNNVVDHQSVLINFENGVTGTHNMIGGAAQSLRKIHIIGTKGEIVGEFEKNMFTIKRIKPSIEKDFNTEIVDLNNIISESKGHGGGDALLTEDFISFQRGEKPSVACTCITDSIAGHLTVFLADKSKDNLGMPQKIDMNLYL